MPTNTVALIGGGRVEYSYDDPAYANLKVQAYDAAGAAVGPAAVFTNNYHPPVVVALASGGYAVGYGVQFHSSDLGVRVFDSAGAVVREVALPGDGPQGDQTGALRLVASPEGGFLVALQRQTPPHNSQSIEQTQLIAYDDQGNAVAGPAWLPGEMPTLAVDGNGDYLVQWQDGSLNHSVTFDAEAPELDAPAAPASIQILDDQGPHTGEVDNSTTDRTPIARVAVAEEGYLVVTQRTVSEAPPEPVGGIQVTAEDVARGYVDVQLSGFSNFSAIVSAYFKNEHGIVSEAANDGFTFRPVPEIWSASDDAGAAQGELADGAVTDDATPTLKVGLESSALYAGDTLRIYEAGQIASTVLTQADVDRGYAEVTLSGLSVGRHTFHAGHPDINFSLDVQAASGGTSTVSLSGSQNVSEGNSGSKLVTFTLTRSGDASGDAAVDYFVWGDADAADFAGPTAGTARFAAGETSKAVTLEIKGDTAVEADESFHLTISNARGAAIGSDTANAVIVNDDNGSGSPDAQPQANNDNASIQLGSTTALTGNLLANDLAGDGAPTVSALRLTHTSDTDGSDGFTQVGRFGTLTVQADGSYSYVLNSSPEAGSTDVFGYEVRDADGDTATASISIQITEGSGGGHPGPGGPTYFGVTGPGSVAEGDSGATGFAFTVTRGGDLSAAGAVDYFVWGGEADGSDFAGPTAGTVRFEAGEQSKTITIDVAGDTADEANETFNLTLSNVRGGALAESTSTASATILNDEGQGGGEDPGGEEPSGTTFALSGPGSVAEGNSGSTGFDFTVTRSGDLSQAGAVDYWVWGGAADGSDFSGATAGTARFEAGQATATITIGVAGDTADEADEAFNVSIANARGGTITTDMASAVILNDEAQGGGEDPGEEEPTTATIAVSGGGQIAEGDTGSTDVVFTFTRSGPATGEALVDYWVWGDAGGSDIAGQLGGTVRFANGETSQTITVSVLGDTVAEADEAFHVSLANARGASLGADMATAVILHNDGWVMA